MSLTLNGTSGITSPGGDTSAGNNTVSGSLSVGTNQTVSGNLLFNSGYGSAATAYGCRAWVNFNGTGTVAINASGNVSSVADNGVGNYTVNFTNAMPDANYAVCRTSNQQGNATSSIFSGSTIAQSATAIRFATGYTSTTGGSMTNTDTDGNNVAVFR